MQTSGSLGPGSKVRSVTGDLSLCGSFIINKSSAALNRDEVLGSIALGGSEDVGLILSSANDTKPRPHAQFLGVLSQ